MTDERFRRAEEQYLHLKGELDAGRMTAEAFGAALEGSMIEHDGRWWMLGANSGAWYVHDGTGWAEAKSPDFRNRALAAAPTAQHPGAGTTGERAGAPPRSGGVAVPAPGAGGTAPARQPPSGAVATILRGLLGLSLTLTAAGLALVIQVWASGYWMNEGKLSVATGTLVAAAFLFCLASVSLFPALPYGVILIASAAWALLGFVGLTRGLPGPTPWWVPDMLWATGLAALAGGVVGFGISKLVGRVAARRTV